MLRLRDDAPFIDDGFGEERPLREAEARALLKACATLSAEPVGLEEFDMVHVEKWIAEVNRAREWAAGGAPPGRDPAGAADAWVEEVRRAREAAQVIRGMGAGDLVKAQRWITAHPNGPGSRGIPLLIEGHKDGSATIVGGAGGKLNGKKLGELKAQASQGPGPKTPAPTAAPAAPAKPPGHTRGKLPWMPGNASPQMRTMVEVSTIQFRQSLEREKAIKARFSDDHVVTDAEQAEMDKASRATDAVRRRLAEQYDTRNAWVHKQVNDFLDEVEDDVKASPPPTAAESRADVKRVQQLAAELRAQHKMPDAPSPFPPKNRGGNLGGSRQMPLFKSARFLLPIAWAAPLAKSTLAAPTTPGEVVDIDGVKARWRLAMSGAGVLEIPLATGKALLVLAATLSGALAAGREELARVLSGLAPRNALIGRPGALTSARK
jgi:hypothetical protein